MSSLKDVSLIDVGLKDVSLKDVVVPGGGTGSNPPPPRTFPPSRTTSVPNFVPIRPAVWISIENRHTLPFMY